MEHTENLICYNSLHAETKWIYIEDRHNEK